MDNLQKETIKQLRESGFGYKAISRKTGISRETIRSFLVRNGISEHKVQSDVCLNCGRQIQSIPGRKPRKFCSRECGLEWWHKHVELMNKKAVYNFICPTCGRDFISYGQSKRKYCSHECYINARFRGLANEV